MVVGSTAVANREASVLHGLCALAARNGRRASREVSFDLAVYTEERVSKKRVRVRGGRDGSQCRANRRTGGSAGISFKALPPKRRRRG
jgi:hypothetical protein